AELAADRPDPGDVAGVVVVLGGEVHEDEVPLLQPGEVPVVVHVPDVVGPGGGDRAVALQPRTAVEEDVAGDGVELVLEDARAGALHRLDQAAAGQLRGAADEGDLAGALDAAQAVEDRGQVADLGAGESSAEQLDELGLARGAAVPEVERDRGV